MKHERYYWGEWLGDFYLLESEKNTLLENCHSHVKKKVTTYQNCLSSRSRHCDTSRGVKAASGVYIFVQEEHWALKEVVQECG